MIHLRESGRVIAIAMSDPAILAKRKIKFSCVLLMDSNATLENVVIPPQKPGSKK